MACILESTEIKKRWPVFNSSQKRWEDIYSIFLFEDQNGYLRLAIDKNRKRLNPVYTFHYLVDGQAIIRKLILDFNLCPKLCFLQKDNCNCEGIKQKYCFGACEQQESTEDYNAIIDNGLSSEDKSCILIINGEFYGMGYIPSDAQINDFETLKDHLTVYKENSVIRNLVYGYAARFPGKVIMLNQAIQNRHPSASVRKPEPLQPGE
jgi:DNA polymerase-3 subunit epsilon